jgi:hypothetical protein
LIVNELVMVATKANDALSVLGFPPGYAPGDTYEGTREFFAGMVDKLALVPLQLSQWIQHEGRGIAASVANTFLPRVAFLAPDFPWERLFIKFSNAKERDVATKAIGPHVKKILSLLTRRE